LATTAYSIGVWSEEMRLDLYTCNLCYGVKSKELVVGVRPFCKIEFTAPEEATDHVCKTCIKMIAEEAAREASCNRS
jgi:hypothetical protein